MPLSKAAPRQQVHARDIRCRGYRRDDGLWDIEGTLLDTKAYTFDNVERGGIAAGEPIHHMSVRITIDDDMVVRAAEAVTDAGPFSICGDVTAAFARLKGLRIAVGWRKAVLEIMGGTKGCTHLTDLLLGPVAVTAYQTLQRIRRERDAARAPGERPPNLDTCYATASDSPVTKRRWPEFYTGTEGEERSAPATSPSPAVPLAKAWPAARRK